MPVYNEAQTVRDAIDRVLALQIPGVTIELITVESNSTDGSRSLVESYRTHPCVEVVLAR